MIDDFISSWDLFAESYLLGAALAALLPLIGVMIVLRRQLFVSVAISQSSMLGMAFGLWIQTMGFWLETNYRLDGWEMVIIFSVLSSLLCIRTPRQSSDQREVATVLIFLMSTTLAYLLLSQSPVGLKEVQERMSSSLISSSMVEFQICLVVFAVLTIFWYLHHHTIVLVCADPETAKAMGWPVLLWELIISTVIGLTLGWAVYLSGWLHAFGCLVLPVFIARRFAKSIAMVLFLAPLLGVTMSFIAYLMAHPLNVSFSQMAIAVMGLTYLLTALVFSKSS